MRFGAGTLIAAAVAFMLGGAVGAVALLPSGSLPIGPAAPQRKPAWTETPWPFARDEWGKGKAYHCSAANCGAAADLYVRAKIGFCNCTTGVADDAELDRLSDFALMGDGVTPLRDGRAIAVAWMQGRSRAYAVAKPIRHGQTALSIAFNDRCDALVATLVLDHSEPAAVETAAIEFLNSETVVRWAKLTLGL